MLERVQFKVYRLSAETEPRYDLFAIDADEHTTVLDGLFRIGQRLDPTLSFRCSCRLGMCGSCAMIINRKERLACQTKVADVGPRITVRPLNNLEVVKDLVVDMRRFFDHWRDIRPYFEKRDGVADAPARIRPGSGSRGIIDECVECITCGACYSACTLVSQNQHFLGPAALARSYTLVQDERADGRDERLDLAAGEEGSLRCHSLFNCAEVCPKGIIPTHPIRKLRHKAVKRALGRKRY